MSFVDLVTRIDRAVQRQLGGVSVIYRPELGAPVQVTGVFDAGYVLVEGSAEAGVEARDPSVFLQLADLPRDPDQDEPTLTIGGVDYRVIERKPDGIGGIVLVLRKVVI